MIFTTYSEAMNSLMCRREINENNRDFIYRVNYMIEPCLYVIAEDVSQAAYIMCQRFGMTFELAHSGD